MTAGSNWSLAAERCRKGDALYSQLGPFGTEFWFEGPRLDLNDGVARCLIREGIITSAGDDLFGQKTAAQTYRSPIDHLVRFLESKSLPIGSEATAQEGLEDLLLGTGIECQREVRLGPRNRIDFIVAGIGIEMKVKGQKRAVLRQIERYAEVPELTGVILFTNLAMGLPSVINNKPVRVASMGRAWL